MNKLNQSSTDPLSLMSALIAVGLCTMFGSNAIAVKMSFSGLGVYFASVVRFSIAFCCLVIWAKFTNQNLAVKRKYWPSLFIISFSFSIQLLLFYTGLSRSPASRSSIIINLQPFFVLIIAHFFIKDDRISLKKILGISLGFLGNVMIFFDRSSVQERIQSGDFLVLLGAFLWGCNAVYTKKVIHRFKAIQVALYPMAAAIPISAIGSYYFDEQMIYSLNSTIVLSIAYQSVFVATFGYVAWNSLLKRYGAVSLHSFIFIMPVTGVALGGLLLDEPISSQLITGLSLIVIGLLVIHIKRKMDPPVSPMGRNT